MSNYRTWFISDGNRDDVGEAAYAFAKAREGEGYETTTIEMPLTADSSELSVEWFVPPSAWEKVYNGGKTADGDTVHAVFGRDADTVAAVLLELSVGHADNGRRSEYPELPGWKFSECINVVTAYYRDDEFPPAGGQPFQVPVVRWYDPAWHSDRGGNIEYSAYWRFEQGTCPWCGGEWAYGQCQRCGAC